MTLTRLAASLLILVPALSLAKQHPPCAGHVAPRSAKAKHDFRHAHPCPGGPDAGSTKRCSGYIIDHVCPLACCGLDAPQNMQWQTKAASNAKDRWELSCLTCGPGSSTGQDGQRPR
jgi:hypothetical protein